MNTNDWEKSFIEKFANPTAKYLGNDFAEYPKANIHDAINFIQSLIASERQKLLEESFYEKGLEDGARGERQRLEEEISEQRWRAWYNNKSNKEKFLENN